MTIRVTIEVPDTKIGKLLSKLNGFKALCEHIPAETTEKEPPRKRSNGETHLTMTGKVPNPKSKLAQALDVFEKLEKRMGIGNVNKAAFRIELTKKKLSKGLAQRCVTEKVLDYL